MWTGHLTLIHNQYFEFQTDFQPSKQEDLRFFRKLIDSKISLQKNPLERIKGQKFFEQNLS